MRAISVFVSRLTGWKPVLLTLLRSRIFLSAPTHSLRLLINYQSVTAVLYLYYAKRTVMAPPLKRRKSLRRLFHRCFNPCLHFRGHGGEVSVDLHFLVGVGQ